MSLHNVPEYNTEPIRVALEAHRLPVDTASLLADAFRVGWVAAMNHLHKTKEQ